MFPPVAGQFRFVRQQVNSSHQKLSCFSADNKSAKLQNHKPGVQTTGVIYEVDP
jgi:hypothetical protein